jgi:hypothetical protein
MDNEDSCVRHRMRPLRFSLIVFLLAVMVVVTAVTSHSDRAEAAAQVPPTESTPTTLYPITGLAPASFSAKLTMTYPTPLAENPVAVLTLRYNPDAEVITYKLEVLSPLAEPTEAAICQGSRGQRGSTVFALFSDAAGDTDFSGMLAEGAIVPDDLVGPLRNDTLADLMELIRSGGAYATIGTRECPVDAARGQIE